MTGKLSGHSFSAGRPKGEGPLSITEHHATGMRRLMIRDLHDVGPACKGKYGPDRLRAIIDLAEPADIDGYVVTPEVIAPADDPYKIALILLIYGTVVVASGDPTGRVVPDA